MDDIVLERNPVTVMKLNEDEQALMDEIEIAPPQAKRPPMRRPKPYTPLASQPPMDPDLAAFMNPQKQTAQQPQFQPQEPEDFGEGPEEYDEGPEGPGGYGESGPTGEEQPGPGYTSVDDEKADILNKLARLAKKGFTVNKRLNAYSSVQELRTEIKRIMYSIEVDQSIKFSRRMLVACVSGVEFLNKRYNPFEIQLEGWSESVMENLDDYDGVFEELYGKYKTKLNVAPEVKLIMMLGGSAMMFHLTNSMFKAAVPNMNDVMKQNPELVKSMMEAVQNTRPAGSMSGASPGGPTQTSSGSESAPGARREMKGPGFDIASLMGGIMMPPPPPVNSNALRAIEEESDDVSDIVSVSGDSTGGEVREVRLGAGGAKAPKKRSKKNVATL
jgi:hypothetical protein